MIIAAIPAWLPSHWFFTGPVLAVLGPLIVFWIIAGAVILISDIMDWLERRNLQGAACGVILAVAAGLASWSIALIVAWAWRLVRNWL